MARLSRTTCLTAANGGAAYIVGALIVISTSFVANKAEEEGIAIFVAALSASCEVEFTNVSFASNAYCCPLGEYGYDDATDTVRTCREYQRYQLQVGSPY